MDRIQCNAAAGVRAVPSPCGTSDEMAETADAADAVAVKVGEGGGLGWRVGVGVRSGGG